MHQLTTLLLNLISILLEVVVEVAEIFVFVITLFHKPGLRRESKQELFAQQSH